MRIKLSLLFPIIGIVITFTFQHRALAAITGPCANCHTMHNSQNGTHMIEYLGFGESDTNTKELLLRATCLGCHAMGTGNSIESIGGNEVPQVYHSGTDLAGGNFAYMLSDDAKGHNVKDFANIDAILDAAPGILPVGGHPNIVKDENLTCAGYIGCHGIRDSSGGAETTGVAKLKGAHHQNVEGKCGTADTVANSYRFLLGVKGLENTTDRWQNKDANSHNEYFGDTTPMDVSCANPCHIGGTGPVRPPNNTISGFCATCHGRFHDSDEVGTTSPFRRHPTDVVLKASGEYASYTNYNVEAPVARPTVYDNPSATVTPGTDVVMCLSCHGTHATNYPDMLRWDYDTMLAGGGGASGTGCFTCHTTKD
jgi:hypothetical protein